MTEARSLHVESPYVRRARQPAAKHRLFCFPHAGAGASVFGDWPAVLPDEIELVAIQLPGREDRTSERPFTDSEPLIRHLTLALRPYLRGSFSFFGHSGGALLAFELARALQRARRPTPAHVVVSGQDAPGGSPGTAPIHALPEPAFRAEVESIGGLSPALAHNNALMEVLLPTLRADFQLWETHQFQPGQPLRSSLTALGGREDPRITKAGQERWGSHTEGRFMSHLFDGGHFYLKEESRSELLSTLGRIILDGTEDSGKVGV